VDLFITLVEVVVAQAVVEQMEILLEMQVLVAQDQ
jgi:hypothetical protein